jgi:hypothetical protein
MSEFIFSTDQSASVTEKNATKNILDGRKDGRAEVKQYTPSGSRGIKILGVEKNSQF